MCLLGQHGLAGRGNRDAGARAGDGHPPPVRHEAFDAGFLGPC